MTIEGPSKDYSPSDGQECTSVLNSRLGGGDQHDPSNESGDVEADHEETSGLGPISKVPRGDRGDAAKDVWGNAHELGGLIGVAHGAHDGRQEEGDGVERGVDT